MGLKDCKPNSVRINCYNLDMRETTEQIVSRIKHISAYNVLVTSDTRSMLTMFPINLGNVFEVSKDVRPKTVLAEEIWGKNAFGDEEEPVLLVNISDITLEQDVTAEGVDASWNEIVNIGSIMYPDHVSRPIMNKLKANMGELTSYRSSAILIIGDVVMDEIYLASLADGTDLVIKGNLSIVEAVSNELIDQKVNTVLVKGEVLCCAENIRILRSKFDPRTGTPKTHVIPEGYEFVKHKLSLTAGDIQYWKGRRINCTENITIHQDVDEAALDRALDGLETTAMVLCPETLGNVLSRKCDTLNTDVLYYVGSLWVVESNLTLRNSRFEFLDGTATLYNSGNVTIDEDVDAQVLYDSLARVYNWGTISCLPDQMSAIEPRTVVEEGLLLDVTSMEDNDEVETEKQDDETYTINAANYKL